jgi:hypothetical protein
MRQVFRFHRISSRQTTGTLRLGPLKETEIGKQHFVATNANLTRLGRLDGGAVEGTTALLSSAGNRRSGERHLWERVRALGSIASQDWRKHLRESRVAQRHLPRAQLALPPVDESPRPHALPTLETSTGCLLFRRDCLVFDLGQLRRLRNGERPKRRSEHQPDLPMETR